MKKYKFAVAIGRFQPFHLGHQKMLEKALELGEKVVVVLGSAKAARNIKNPWTAEEREVMIRSTLSAEDQARVVVTHCRDYYYSENMWVAEIQGRVRQAMVQLGGTDGLRGKCDVALVGHNKDASSYYLTLFPQWTFEEHASHSMLNATDIREKLFDLHSSAAWANDLGVPQSVHDWLHDFTQKPEFLALRDEHKFIAAYRKMWESAPYPVTFVTVDAVVIKSGHVLVVRRKASPGKGLIALPGGFVGQYEKLLDACIRELKEETGIRVAPRELRASIKESRVLDEPNRSLRGRTISHAFLIDLGNGDLPHVKGDDDAEDAFWMPLFDAFGSEEQFFEDHVHVIRLFTQK